MITITRTVHFTHGRGGRKQIVREPALSSVLGRIPRISKLMALAIKFDGILREGVVSDQSELARLARVSQPRMTQILNLNHLAPQIQEELLFLPLISAGRDPVQERMLRPLCAKRLWEDQWIEWTARKATPRLSAKESI